MFRLFARYSGETYDIDTVEPVAAAALAAILGTLARRHVAV